MSRLAYDWSPAGSKRSDRARKLDRIDAVLLAYPSATVPALPARTLTGLFLRACWYWLTDRFSNAEAARVEWVG